jgi:formate hydrogenlyase subunit 4
MALTVGLALQGLQMLLVLALAPLLLGFTRKVKARLLRRRGPPVLQPYRDLLKLFRKEAVLADSASWLFRSGPYMIFAATWVAAALVPTFATGLIFSYRDRRHHRPCRLGALPGARGMDAAPTSAASAPVAR